MSGYTKASLRTAHDAVLPNGTNVYVTLLTVAPDDDETGYVEIPLGGWFSRVAVSDWLIQIVDGKIVRKVNKSNVSFAQNTSGADIDVVAVAIFDASTAGNLVAWQPTMNIADTAITVNIPINDTPLIGADQLRIGFGPDAAKVSGATVTTEATVQTIDATPKVIRIATTLGTDGDAVHIEAIVRGKSQALNKNYYRRIRASYFRDDAAAGSAIWALRHQTVDGVPTRAPGNTPFTTATSYLQLTGDRVDLYVKGEAVPIDWAASVTVIKD